VGGEGTGAGSHVVAPVGTQTLGLLKHTNHAATEITGSYMMTFKSHPIKSAT